MVCNALRRAIAEFKQHLSVGWVTKNLLFRAAPCFGMHIKPLSRLNLQSLAPTNPHWAGVVGYGPFSLCVMHKEGMSQAFLMHRSAPPMGTLIG
jgi:hypothetical protein